MGLAGSLTAVAVKGAAVTQVLADRRNGQRRRKGWNKGRRSRVREHRKEQSQRENQCLHKNLQTKAVLVVIDPKQGSLSTKMKTDCYTQ
jgi:hypothetical protein